MQEEGNAGWNLGSFSVRGVVEVSLPSGSATCGLTCMVTLGLKKTQFQPGYLDLGPGRPVSPASPALAKK